MMNRKIRARKNSEIHVKDELRRRLLEAGDCPLDSRAKTIYYLKYCQENGYPWKDLYVREKVIMKKFREIEEISEVDYLKWIQAEDHRCTKYRTFGNQTAFQTRIPSNTRNQGLRRFSPRMHPYNEFPQFFENTFTTASFDRTLLPRPDLNQKPEGNSFGNTISHAAQFPKSHSVKQETAANTIFSSSSTLLAPIGKRRNSADLTNSQFEPSSSIMKLLSIHDPPFLLSPSPRTINETFNESKPPWLLTQQFKQSEPQVKPKTSRDHVPKVTLPPIQELIKSLKENER